MDVLDEAIIFATEKHAGQTRKMFGTPYILHPMEVAGIIGTITNHREVLAAGILHDTVEDCGVSPDELREKFGNKVTDLVLTETEDKMKSLPAESTWKVRKEQTLSVLKSASDRDVKILWLADKLANLRSFYRGYNAYGDGLWNFFHQRDPQMHKWYYQSIAEYTKELSDTEAYAEYTELIKKLFN